MVSRAGSAQPSATVWSRAVSTSLAGPVYRLADSGARRIALVPASVGLSCPVAAGLSVWEWEVVQPAARRYFGVGADKLTTVQAARLAAILPSPLKWKVVKPGKYVAKRSRRIGAASGTVRREGLAACVV